jgi:hypothetical protein
VTIFPHVLSQREDQPADRKAAAIAAILECDRDDVMGLLIKLEREGLALSIFDLDVDAR